MGLQAATYSEVGAKYKVLPQLSVYVVEMAEM